MSRKSVSDFTPIFMRSLSSGAAINTLGNGPSRILGRRGSAAPPSASPVPRKVIQVALQQPVQLHTTENAWKPAALKHEKPLSEEHIQSEVVIIITLFVLVAKLHLIPYMLTVIVSVS